MNIHSLLIYYTFLTDLLVLFQSEHLFLFYTKSNHFHYFMDDKLVILSFNIKVITSEILYQMLYLYVLQPLVTYITTISIYFWIMHTYMYLNFGWILLIVNYIGIPYNPTKICIKTYQYTFIKRPTPILIFKKSSILFFDKALFYWIVLFNIILFFFKYINYILY